MVDDDLTYYLLSICLPTYLLFESLADRLATALCVFGFYFAACAQRRDISLSRFLSYLLIMGRTRAVSNATSTSGEAPTQVGMEACKRKRKALTAAAAKELGSMYDYLAKVVLLGPSGAGK